jgi:hypothetical protein
LKEFVEREEFLKPLLVLPVLLHGTVAGFLISYSGITNAATFSSVKFSSLCLSVSSEAGGSPLLIIWSGYFLTAPYYLIL